MLADPTFDTCAVVDVLLGADVVSAVLTREVVLLGSGLPTTVRTNCGFVIIGSVAHCLLNVLILITPDAVCTFQCHAVYHQVLVSTCVVLTSPQDDDPLALCKRFWEAKEPLASSCFRTFRWGYGWGFLWTNDLMIIFRPVNCYIYILAQSSIGSRGLIQ